MSSHSPPHHTTTLWEKDGLDDRNRSSDSESENGAIELDKRLPFAQLMTCIFSPIRLFRTWHWRAFIIRLAWFFVPSFLQGRHMREQIRPAKISPTAYLDGIRGLAALFVYFCHYTYQGFHIAFAWGANDSHYEIMKLPFIRLWYSGPAGVAVFFVISGYALSYRPIKLIRARNVKEFSNSMASNVFRRAVRLFAPPLASSLLVVICLRLGLYELTREFARNPMYHRNIMEPHPIPLESTWAELKSWAWASYDMVWVFGWEEQGGRNPYDVHLWTIPMEYRCSLYLFLVIIGTARLRTFWRYMTLLAVMAVSYRRSRWELLMFFFGMGIAEWDHIRGAHISHVILPLGDKQPTQSRSDTITKTFWNMVCILGLYLLSYPDDGAATTPGYITLSSFVPAWWAVAPFRYWQGIGAVVFIIGVGRSQSFLNFFNSAVVQYFGKISYALYLMHGLAMHTLGYHWEKWAYSITGVEGDRYTVGWALGAIFCVPTVIWCADIFWRAVDIPSVKFGKWLENKLIVKDE